MNILQARTVVKESQENENSTHQQAVENQSLVQPQKALSAYILFIKDLKTKQDGQIQQQDRDGEKRNFLQEASKLWGSLPAEEKAKFTEMSNKQKAEYAEYEEKRKQQQYEVGEDGELIEEHGEEEQEQQRRKFMQLPMSRIRTIINLDDDNN